MAKLKRTRAPREFNFMSFEERRQKELAWMLYITEGYVANLHKALIRCALTTDDNTFRIMQQIEERGIKTAEQLRYELQRDAKRVRRKIQARSN